MENLSILIFLKTRVNSKGENPIYLRITVDGKRKEKSLNRSIKANKWNFEKQRGKGSNEVVKTLNEYLNSETNKVYTNRQELLHQKIKLTAEELMNKYSGVSEKQRILIEIFENENNHLKKLYKSRTIKMYITVLNHVKNFLLFHYKVSDIDIKKINHLFVMDFDRYLRIEKNIANNTTIRYVGTLRKIVKTSLFNGWIDKDPFLNYNMKKDKVEKEYLTEAEISKIYKKEFTIIRLDQVRDVFIFCCYTGLAYSDVKKLKNSDIITNMNGDKIIRIRRQKTNILSTIPILPIAQAILDKYKNCPFVINLGTLLPVPSNQRLNGYLKEIGEISGVEKILTSHTARYSFASTITLFNDVPIETISKMMGHSNIRMTSHYAKMHNQKVENDMAILKDKLNSNNKKSKKSKTKAV